MKTKDAVSLIGESISEGGCGVEMWKYEQASLVVLVNGRKFFRLEVTPVTDEGEVAELLKEYQ